MPKVAEDDVSKRSKVQLTAGWWKTAWPLDDKPRNYNEMMNCLKTYKAERRGRSVQDLEEALEDIGKCTNALQTEAAKIQNHRNKKKAIIKDLQAVQDIVNKELGVLDKVGSQETVVYKKSFGAALTENLKDLKITFDGLLVELSLLELLVIELRARRAESMLNNALNDEFDRVVDACSKEIRARVKKNHGIVNKDDATKAAARHAKVLGMQIRKVPDEVIRKIGLNQKIARKYKRDKAVKITRGVAATGLSAAGVAVPGTTAFAIVGLVRSIAALAKEITTVMMSVESKMKIIVSYLETLGGIYKKHRGAREVTMSALNTILGVEVLPTLNKAKADFKEVEKSVAVLSHRSQKMQTKVIKALEKSNELTKQYEKNVSDLRAFMASSRTGKVKKAMKNLDKILDGTHKIVKRVVAAEKQVPLIRRQLKDLGENPGGVDKANIIISQTINLCNALAGIADAAAVGKAIESVVLADLNAWNDAVDIGKEIADL